MLLVAAAPCCIELSNAQHDCYAQACRIAKLFAKHMKLPEQQKHLESHVVGVGCGTPNRLLKLADIDALKLDRLKLLVLDMQLDAKQRYVLTCMCALVYQVLMISLVIGS